MPEADSSFSVQPAPRQKELQAVLPLLQAAGAPFGVTQAAVWIITDNADYDDLGTLVSGSVGGVETREIREPEAAQAMVLMERAGINITKPRSVAC